MLGAKIDIWIRNKLYKLKKWWDKGSKKFVIKEVPSYDFTCSKSYVIYFDDDVDRDIKTAKQFYMGKNDILHYIERDGDFIRIVYYEGIPEVACVMNTNGEIQ